MAVGRVWYGAKHSHGMWEQFAHTFEKSDFWLNMRVFWYTIFVWRQFWKLHFLVCVWRSAVGKMTVLTIGSYQGFVKNIEFLGETLLQKESRWVFHFPSFFIIELFHHVWDIQTHLSWVIFFLVPLVSPGYMQLQVHTLVSPSIP